LLVGALGRCMAAHIGLPEEELRRHYGTLRLEAPVSFETFMAEVEDARRDGYAVNRDGFVRGITTVSSVVLDAERRPFLALSVVGLSAQLDGERVTSIGHDLRDTVRRVGAALADPHRGPASAVRRGAGR
jgi:DNA-binding IclR family transcriptional regulator